IGSQTFGSTQFPSDLAGLLLNVTIAQDGPSGGFLTVYPGDVTAPPNASTVNPSTAIAHNFWAVGVPTSGQFAGTIAVFSTNALDLLVALVGFSAPSNPNAAGTPKFINPVRVLDTRGDSGGPIGLNADGSAVTAGRFTPNSLRRFKLANATFGGT